MSSIALTGHRPTKLDGYDRTTPFYRRLQEELLRIALRALHASKEILELHSGMALGADTVWAEAISMLKQRYPDRVRFVAHVPMPGQPDRWPAQARSHYPELLARGAALRTHAGPQHRHDRRSTAPDRRLRRLGTRRHRQRGALRTQDRQANHRPPPQPIPAVALQR